MKILIRLAACAAFTLLTAPLLHAQVPQLVNYQGRVAVGTTNFNGTGQFKFALVNTNGSIVYWTNSADTAPADGVPDAAVSLTVTKGLYSVLLGDTSVTNMAAIPASVWANADVRLRVWFNDGTNGNQLLTPDQRLAPTAYLADGTITNAKIATGAVDSAQLAGSAVTAAKIASGAVTNAKLSNNAVQAANIASGAVTPAKLNLQPAGGPPTETPDGGPGMSLVLYPGSSTPGNSYPPHGFGIEGNTLYSVVPEGNRFVWYGGTNEVMRLTAAGNLGIGTDSPGAKLEVGNGTTSLQVRPGQLFNDTFQTGDVTLDIPGNHTLGIWDSLSVFSDLNVGGDTYHQGRVGIGNLLGLKGSLHVEGDYYGKGHLWLHAINGDGQTGVAYVQARDDSGTSSIDLQFRTQNAGSISEAMRITPAGNVGVQTTTPRKRLEVATAVTNRDGIRITGNNVGGASVVLDLTTYDPEIYSNFFNRQPTSRIEAVDVGGYTSRLDFQTKFYGSAGNDLTRRVSIGGGNDSLYVEVGGVNAWKARRSDNDYYFDVTSDRRLKTGIKTLTGALDTIDRLRPVRFHYTAEHLAKSPNNPDIEHIGVIAQEFQEIFPDYVTKDAEGYLSVKASPVMFVTAAAVKELNAKYEAAMKQKDEEIAGLRKQLADTSAAQAARDQALEARLARLEQAAPAATPSTASAPTPAAAVVKVALKK